MIVLTKRLEISTEGTAELRSLWEGCLVNDLYESNGADAWAAYVFRATTDGKVWFNASSREKPEGTPCYLDIRCRYCGHPGPDCH